MGEITKVNHDKKIDESHIDKKIDESHIANIPS